MISSSSGDQPDDAVEGLIAAGLPAWRASRSRRQADSPSLRSSSHAEQHQADRDQQREADADQAADAPEDGELHRRPAQHRQRHPPQLAHPVTSSRSGRHGVTASDHSA